MHCSGESPGCLVVVERAAAAAALVVAQSSALASYFCWCVYAVRVLSDSPNCYNAPETRQPSVGPERRTRAPWPVSGVIVYDLEQDAFFVHSQALVSEK